LSDEKMRVDIAGLDNKLTTYKFYYAHIYAALEPMFYHILLTLHVNLCKLW